MPKQGVKNKKKMIKIMKIRNQSKKKKIFTKQFI